MHADAIRFPVRAEDAPALPVDDFLDHLHRRFDAIMTEPNRIWEAVGHGTLPLPLLRRLCMEYYFLGRWYTSEFASLVANAPDVDALTLDSSRHFHHWLSNLADEVGLLGDRNHVDMKVEWARQLDIPDEELDAYVAIPESIGMVFTCLYYMRRSYEEGLAAFGWASERWAASTGYAKLLYEGLRDHYGLDVANFRVHAYAEQEHAAEVESLLREVALTSGAQRRIERAVVHVATIRNSRLKAMNAWLD